MRARVGFCVSKQCNTERPLFRRGKQGYRCVVCRERVELPNKYHSKPTRSVHTGRLIHSKTEAARESVLLAWERNGVISDLKYQVPFRLELYSTQAVDALLDCFDGTTLGDYPSDSPLGRLMRLAVEVRLSRQLVAKYIADYVYIRDGHLVVEDPKGARTPVYLLKRKLMVLAHNVEIQEPGRGGVQQWARGSGVKGPGTGSRLAGGR